MNDYYPFINIPLPYEYSSMEPFIDTKTMELHHDRHLQTYIDNLNAALKERPQLQRLSLEQLILSASKLPPDLSAKIGNNAGGVYNHRFFFSGIVNPQGALPEGWLGRAIDKTYGSFDMFRDEFVKAALSVFGSGYAWLAAEKFGKLKIITTANQDTPLTMGLCPVLNIDVWEHAYYLKHYNKRADYIGDWLRVADWNKANQNYLQCLGVK